RVEVRVGESRLDLVDLPLRAPDTGDHRVTGDLVVLVDRRALDLVLGGTGDRIPPQGGKALLLLDGQAGDLPLLRLCRRGGHQRGDQCRSGGRHEEQPSATDGARCLCADFHGSSLPSHSPLPNTRQRRVRARVLTSPVAPGTGHDVGTRRAGVAGGACARARPDRRPPRHRRAIAAPPPRSRHASATSGRRTSTTALRTHHTGRRRPVTRAPDADGSGQATRVPALRRDSMWGPPHVTSTTVVSKVAIFARHWMRSCSPGPRRPWPWPRGRPPADAWGRPRRQSTIGGFLCTDASSGPA